jgi:hypothetical protein
MSEHLKGQGQALAGSFEEARCRADEDFQRKTHRQRLEWLEAAQQLYRIGQQRVAGRVNRGSTPD